MPGLLRNVAATAVWAGTATAVSNRVSRRQQNRWAAQDAPSYEERSAAPSEPSASGAGQDRVSQLKDLGDLKTQGILTEEEFAAEKARILAG